MAQFDTKNSIYSMICIVTKCLHAVVKVVAFGVEVKKMVLVVVVVEVKVVRVC